MVISNWSYYRRLEKFFSCFGISFHLVASRKLILAKINFCSEKKLRKLIPLRKYFVNNRYYDLRKEAKKGRIDGSRANDGIPRAKQQKTLDATSWMGNYFDKTGDRMPHILRVKLPSCISKTEVYNYYKQVKYNVNQHCWC